MKRSPLKRGKGLERKTPLRSTSGPLRVSAGKVRGLGRDEILDRQTGLERAKPKARGRSAPRRWKAAKGTRCEICGRRGGRLVQHHAIYAQHVEGFGGDVWDPRNSVTVCDGPGSCHAGQHDRTRPIALAALPDAVFDFARELQGLAAHGYLRRRYAGDDPRLDALLEEA